MNDEITLLTENKITFYPESISKYATQADSLFYFILILSTILFIGLIATCVYFYLQYRKNNAISSTKRHVTHNNYIEFTWTIIPTFIVMMIFFWGFSDFIKLTIPPTDTMKVRVTGKKWFWEFEYPNGTKTIGELVVPKDKSVELVMSSVDVLHSFYIPNLRVKRDVIPNRYTSLWFNAEKTGTYQIFCTEYCGDAHSNMGALLKVKTLDEYKKWIKTGGAVGKDLPLDKADPSGIFQALIL